ncbi:MAG: hypothetical protein JJE17_09775 [Peptostreptococcaceae bacterium]|nr:hypothetical protein [Peptostreptococcaceae bacterium]HZK60531.1 hypothetical protein [Anaerovoracaceae bacterium]
MGRRGITIDEKIKKQDLQGKELLNAFVNSDKSLDEILAFMGGKHGDNE